MWKDEAHHSFSGNHATPMEGRPLSTAELTDDGQDVVLASEIA